MPSIIARVTRFLSASSLLLSLCACGGGGGSSDANPGPGSSPGPGNPTLPAAAAPLITVQPQNVSAVIGTGVSFLVTATGDAPLSYQWQRNGANLDGATGAQYQLAAAQLADSTSKWSVIVRNKAGSVASAQATLTVTGSTLLAGALQARAFVNGQLVGIARDGNGNTYLLDRGMTTALHKVDGQGAISLLPLTPSAPSAALYQPTGMARDVAAIFMSSIPAASCAKSVRRARSAIGPALLASAAMTTDPVASAPSATSAPWQSTQARTSMSLKRRRFAGLPLTAVSRP